MGARERWSAAGYEEVTLPSGFKVRGVRPTTRDLMLHDLLPSDLAALVMGAEGAKKAGRELTPAERGATVAAQRIEAAAFVRQVWDDEAQAWEAATILAADLNGTGFDPRDVDALEDIVLYRRTPAQITAETLAARGEISPAAAAAASAEEVGDTVDGQAGFRDDGRGDAAGADGGAVRRAPKSVLLERRPVDVMLDQALALRLALADQAARDAAAGASKGPGIPPGLRYQDLDEALAAELAARGQVH